GRSRIGRKEGTTVTATTAMQNVGTPDRLRSVLLVDGVLCAAMGVGLAVLAGQVAGLLGLSATFLRWAGIVLLPWPALVLFIANRSPLSRSGTVLVVGGNIAWAVASVALLATGTLSPTTAGYAFVIAQALLVLVLAEI